MDGLQVRYRSATLVVGEFRGTHDPAVALPAGGTHQVVFSRYPVHYRPERATAFVADPTLVAYLNAGEPVRREPVAGGIDHHVLLGLDDDAVAELQAGLPAAGGNRFARWHGPTDVRTYGAVWALARHLGGRYARTDLHLEEQVLGLVRGLLADAHDHPPPARRTATIRAHAQLVADVKQVVAERLHDQLTLAHIAAAVASSPYHVARVFREHTGTTIHAFQTQLRLARALEEVRDGDRPLTQVAVEHGFSHSSHFTRLFRRAFGTPPSAYRRAARRFDLDELTWLLPR